MSVHLWTYARSLMHTHRFLMHIRLAGIMKQSCVTGVIAGSGFQRAAFFIY